ncbi:hypothetical protein [Loigolactobacillus zhaoyuanensis]|uniref:HTH cro/C1-type domain-containing protein n=1 Tax=Loigolactobacillus zhaoyuanensis TaxID=2486017 RepID=A0ABW8UBV2_9LACO|nr:hypothetical protein [Loigolactobacillus zhaoyuanensis]
MNPIMHTYLLENHISLADVARSGHLELAAVENLCRGPLDQLPIYLLKALATTIEQSTAQTLDELLKLELQHTVLLRTDLDHLTIMDVAFADQARYDQARDMLLAYIRAGFSPSERDVKTVRSALQRQIS